MKIKEFFRFNIWKLLIFIIIFLVFRIKLTVFNSVFGWTYKFDLVFPSFLYAESILLFKINNLVMCAIIFIFYFLIWLILSCLIYNYLFKLIKNATNLIVYIKIIQNKILLLNNFFKLHRKIIIKFFQIFIIICIILVILFYIFILFLTFNSCSYFTSVALKSSNLDIDAIRYSCYACLVNNGDELKIYAYEGNLAIKKYFMKHYYENQTICINNFENKITSNMINKEIDPYLCEPISMKDTYCIKNQMDNGLIKLYTNKGMIYGDLKRFKT